MTKLEQAILSMHAAGQPFVLASVSEGSGSMPRHRGACMRCAWTAAPWEASAAEHWRPKRFSRPEKSFA